MIYPYSTQEQLKSGKPYHFAEYDVQEFLAGYRKSRDFVGYERELQKGDVIKNHEEIERLRNSLPQQKEIITKSALEIISQMLLSGEKTKEIEDLLKGYRRKFEIQKLKKIHQGEALRNIGKEAEVTEFVFLGVCLGLHYLQTNNLQSLSTLLKVNDHIIAYKSVLSKKETKIAHYSLQLEKEGIEKLWGKLKKNPLGERLQKKYWKVSEARTMQNAGMIVQDKLRSRAYLQVLLDSGWKPAKVILVEPRQKGSDALEKPMDGNHFFNDIEKVQETCRKNDISFEVVTANDFNEPQVAERLRKQKEDYYIFSGSGILQEGILSTGKKLIHVHPGIVPAYRGSTCFLYSLLAEGKCGATAFFMDVGIDTGEIILQREFLPPAAGADIDRGYDNYIRALLLAEVAEKLANGGEIKGLRQNSEAGETYYIMHPLLRVLAAAYYKNKMETLNLTIKYENILQ